MKHHCKTCTRLECPFKKRSAYLEFRLNLTFATRLEFAFAPQPRVTLSTSIL